LLADREPLVVDGDHLVANTDMACDGDGRVVGYRGAEGWLGVGLDLQGVACDALVGEGDLDPGANPVERDRLVTRRSLRGLSLLTASPRVSLCPGRPSTAYDLDR
jgi:hypothetical protein